MTTQIHLSRFKGLWKLNVVQREQCMTSLCSVLGFYSWSPRFIPWPRRLNIQVWDFLDTDSPWDEVPKPCTKHAFLPRQTKFRSLNTTAEIAGAQILQKYGNHLKVLSTIRVTWNKFHTQGTRTLGATVQTTVARTPWRPGFVYTSSKLLA